ncbi:T9SS type A sorting domain-containing protein [Balneolales bacterium ANBcel1]|nr:T9SS type A sorting domain-containing protein [Balneolales bacterium ANBcel1]
MNVIYRAVTTGGGILTAVLLGALFLAAGDAYGQHSGGRSAVTGSVSNVVGQGVAGAGVHLVDQVLSDTLATAQSGPDGMFVLEYDSEVGIGNPYPNPTSDESNILVTSEGGNKEVGVYDVLGRRIHSSQIEFEKGSNKVSLSGFPSSGVYLVNVRGKDFNETAKLTSLGRGSDFNISVTNLGGDSSSSSLSLVVDESENYNGFMQTVPFGRNVNENITLEDKLFEAITEGRLVNVDGGDVSGRLVKSYAGKELEKDVDGSFGFSVDVPRRLLGEEVVYRAVADGFREGTVSRSLKENIDLDVVVLGDEYFSMVTEGHLRDVDGGDVSGSVSMSYKDNVVKQDVDGSFGFSVDVPRRLLGEEVVYRAVADGFRDETVSRGLEELVDLDVVVLGDEYFSMVTRGSLEDVAGEAINGRVVKSYAGVSKEKDVSGDFELSLDVPMRLVGGDSLSYVFSAEGFEDVSKRHSLEVLVDLGDVALDRSKPVLSVSKPDEVKWFSGDFSINASSVNELDSLVLKVEDKVYGWNINGNEVDEGVSHSFENTGRIPYTVKAFDVHGTKKVLEDFVDVRERHDFRVEARGFFDKNPNPYASIQARHLESGRDTTMVADGDGIISSVLPRGDYVLDIIGGEEASVVDGVPGMSEVNRLMVSENEYPVPGMFWHGAERDGVPVTYVVSGYGPRELENHRTNTGNVEVLFRLRDDFDSHMETVENKFDVDTHGYFIDEWSRFNDVIWVDQGDWEGSDRHPFVILPDVTEEQVVVFNKGNSAYGRGWNVAVAAGNHLPREDHPDGGLYLPGSSWNEEELENWEIFKEDMRSVLEDSLDINPFSIKFVEDYAENLTDLGYVNDYGGYSGSYMDLADNVMYVGRTNLGGIENRIIRIRDPPSPSGHPNPPPIGYDNNERIMLSSFFFVNGSLPSWYTNELNHFFSTVNEPNPGICSVKDFNTSAIVNPDPPSYCTDRQEVKYVDDEGKHLRSGNPKDFMVWMASAGFGGFPQQQISQVYMQKLGEDPVAVEYVLESDEWDPRSSYDDRNRGVGNAYKGFNLMLPKTE